MQSRWFTNMTRSARRSTVVAIVSTVAAAGIAVVAWAGPTVPTPTITTRPANPTNQTSAQFTYTDSQVGVSFQCELDGAAFAACPSSGITYAGPLGNGSHTFKVRAVAGTKTSSAASYTWTIDKTPPTVSISFPANKHVYGESEWNKGCSGGPGLCGSATDPQGVSSVIVSIQQGSGNWWGGSSFNKTSEYFNATTLAAPGANSTGWRFPLSLPANGSYTVHLRATDGLGNTTAPASQLATTFTIDAAPPTPSITSGPNQQTTATTATFTFTDAETGVTFLCRLDAGSFSGCKSPKSYTGLSQSSHTFYVEAMDGKGKLSTPASYSWTVGKKTVEELPFAITASLSELLAPGLSRPLALTISNPNGVQILVTSLTVSVQTGSTKAGCDGPTNLTVTQSNASGTNMLAVPPGGHVTLPSGAVSAPQVLMNDLASNQDLCKGASFTFSYSGSAHS
jgi:hypothetical protein